MKGSAEGKGGVVFSVSDGDYAATLSLFYGDWQVKKQVGGGSFLFLLARM